MDNPSLLPPTIQKWSQNIPDTNPAFLHIWPRHQSNSIFALWSHSLIPPSLYPPIREPLWYWLCDCHIFCPPTPSRVCMSAAAVSSRPSHYLVTWLLCTATSFLMESLSVFSFWRRVAAVSVCLRWVDSTSPTLPYFLFSIGGDCCKGEGEELICGPFHATMISSNLIQPSSFSLVCFLQIGARSLQKPCVCVFCCVCVCVCVRVRERKGDWGRKTEVMSSECVCMYKYLCVK